MNDIRCAVSLFFETYKPYNYSKEHYDWLRKYIPRSCIDDDGYVFDYSESDNPIQSFIEDLEGYQKVVDEFNFVHLTRCYFKVMSIAKMFFVIDDENYANCDPFLEVRTWRSCERTEEKLQEVVDCINTDTILAEWQERQTLDEMKAYFLVLDNLHHELIKLVWLINSMLDNNFGGQFITK